MKKNSGIPFFAGVVFYSLIPLVSFAAATNASAPSVDQQPLITTNTATRAAAAQPEDDRDVPEWFVIPLRIIRGGTGATSFTNGSIPFISNDIFSQNNSQLFWDTVNNALSVGGTTTPSAKMTVKGSGSLGLFNIAASSGTSLLYINSSGNVGIATTSPSEKLQVIGNIKLSGTLFTSSLNTTGTSTLWGNVGIGNSNPQHALDVSGSMYSRLVSLSDSSSVTVDWNAGNVQSISLNTGNSALTFANGRPGAEYKLILKQDATGGRAVAWPASVKWAGGTAPVLTSAAGAADVMSFVYDGTNYLGSYNLAYGVAAATPPSSGIAFDNAEYGGVTVGSPTNVSLNYTVGSSPNRILILGVDSACADQSGVTPLSATYNSVPMTSYKSLYDDTGTGKLWLFYLTNPTSGTHTLTVTQGVNPAACLVPMLMSYTGVDQSNPIETSASSGGTGVSNITVTSTSLTPSDWGIFAIVSGGSVLASTNVTARVNGNNTPFMGDSNGLVGASIFSMTVSVSPSSDNNALSVFLKAAR